MNLLKNSIVLGIVTTGFCSMAVTPAPQALTKVKAFLDVQARAKIESALPFYEGKTHLIQIETGLARGKYSEKPNSFADFQGRTKAILQLNSSDTYFTVDCDLSATATVVPFAKQLVPILEEEVNRAQLTLKRHEVSCKLLK